MCRHYVKNNEELAKNMRFIRECRGFSQKEVAEKLNVKRSTYTYYEVGKTKPDLQALIKLCEIYGIELNDLITKEGLLEARVKMDEECS